MNVWLFTVRGRLRCNAWVETLSCPQTWKLVNFQVPRFTRSQCSVDGQSTGTDWTDRVDGRQEQSTKSGQPRTLSKKVRRRDKRSSHDTCKVHGQHRDSSILLGHSTRHRAREGCYLEFLEQAEAAGMSHSVSKMQPLGSSPALPSQNDPTESLWRLDSGTLGC